MNTNRAENNNKKKITMNFSYHFNFSLIKRRVVYKPFPITQQDNYKYVFV